VYLTETVHNTGKGIAGIYSKEVAEMKVIQSMDFAKMLSHPLLVTMEAE
jgi:ATP-dependent Clp protease adaptor protein ClpS